MATGTCKYCGQMRQVPFSENLTDEDMNRIATEECDCDKAMYERNVRHEVAKAQNAIEKIILPRYQKTAEVLMFMADSLARGNANAIQITQGDGAKVTARATSKGIAIKIVDTITTTVEDAIDG